MAQPNPIVFLVDVDDTLLENDRIQDDIRGYLGREFGPACRDRPGGFVMKVPVVDGGGTNGKILAEKATSWCRAGDKANAFLGGVRLWEKESVGKPSPRATARRPSIAAKARLDDRKETQGPETRLQETQLNGQQEPIGA